MSQRKWKKKLRSWAICSRVALPDPLENSLSLGVLCPLKEATGPWMPFCVVGKCKALPGSRQGEDPCNKTQPEEN